MIDIILLGILILGVFIGLKRGFILQLFHLIGFVVAFIVASVYFEKLASKLILWIPYPALPEDASWTVFLETLPLEEAFYKAVAFAALFFATKIILQIIATMLDFVAELPVLNSINGILGAVLGFIETYLLLFVILYIAALAPVEIIQNLIGDSGVAGFIIDHTPVISDLLTSHWFE